MPQSSFQTYAVEYLVILFNHWSEETFFLSHLFKLCFNFKALGLHLGYSLVQLWWFSFGVGVLE